MKKVINFAILNYSNHLVTTFHANTAEEALEKAKQELKQNHYDAHQISKDWYAIEFVEFEKMVNEKKAHY